MKLSVDVHTSKRERECVCVCVCVKETLYNTEGYPRELCTLHKQDIYFASFPHLLC